MEQELQARKTVVDDSLREIKMHGTAGFPLGVYLDDFSDFENGYICWHWHEEVQFTVILEGEFVCQVESEEIHLGEGDTVFINSGRLHQIKPCRHRSGKLYSFIWRGELMGNREGEVYRNCIAPVLEASLPWVLWRKEEEPGAGAFREVVELYQRAEGTYQLRILMLLASVWLELFRHISRDSREMPPEVLRDKERVKGAMQYMQENYREQLGLDEIAEAVFISRSELCRSFQRTLHLTPMEFLMEYRIRQSLILLKNRELRVLDVAEMTGFCSPSHFGTHFRKYMGCTPREYRAGNYGMPRMPGEI